MNHDISSGHPLWRGAPAHAYARTGRQLIVSRNLVTAAHAVLAPYAARRVEACCFLYGVIRAENLDAAVALVLPQQINRRGSFDLTADAIATTAAATRPRQWLNLAQIHTHPGAGVEHSHYDDVHVNSRRALSIVLPWYGRREGAWPRDIGVHEFQGDYWHLLDGDDAALRVVLGDGPGEVMDLRA